MTVSKDDGQETALLGKFLNSLGYVGAGSFDLSKVRELAAAIDSCIYVEANMANAKQFSDAHELLTFALQAVSVDGQYLEFGVYSGRSINHIARSVPAHQVFGFDSFEGLPEKWRDDLGIGAFAVSELPVVEPNVTLIKGWFDETLPSFVKGIGGAAAAFIHIDCDLYSSTQTVLSLLKNRIVPGSIIVFDEYFNYPNWRAHEYLAFRHFVGSNCKSYEYIGFVPSHQQVAVRVLA